MIASEEASKSWRMLRVLPKYWPSFVGKIKTTGKFFLL
jgi:hypothetical protein